MTSHKKPSKKVERTLRQMGESTERKKTRKRRKPMTEEQRVAATERLKKARAAKGEPKNKSVHPDVRNLPDEHPLNVTNVKAWIKSCKQELKSLREIKNSKHWKERLDYQTKENYIANMERYLRDGIWLDSKWGENAEFKMRTLCLTKAYDKEGLVKRNRGTFYTDAGEYYGE